MNIHYRYWTQYKYTCQSPWLVFLKFHPSVCACKHFPTTIGAWAPYDRRTHIHELLLQHRPCGWHAVGAVDHGPWHYALAVVVVLHTRAHHGWISCWAHRTGTGAGHAPLTWTTHGGSLRTHPSIHWSWQHINTTCVCQYQYQYAQSSLARS